MLLLRNISILVALMLLVTGCSKEETVEPCTSSTEHDGAPKGLASSPAGGSDPAPLEGDTAEPTAEDDQNDDSSGISDDGDDISDSEKKRKKRR